MYTTYDELRVPYQLTARLYKLFYSSYWQIEVISVLTGIFWKLLNFTFSPVYKSGEVKQT
jgi:hypothetical protein